MSNLRIFRRIRLHRPIRQESVGFSLLELLFVLSIIAVITAVALPRYANWQRRSAVTGAARALMAHMKQGRLLAVAENRNVSITFTSTSYIFDADTGGGCTQCKKQKVDLKQFSQELSLSPTTTRTFTSRGTVNQSGTITITAGPYSKQLVINVIGRTYLQ